MLNPEIEPTQSLWDQHMLEPEIHQLGLLHGIRGLKVVVRPGKGWSCAKTEQGLVITVDPLQTTEGHGTEHNAGIEPPKTSPEITSLFIAAHELGHASDFLDKNWQDPINQSSSDKFFNNLVDDTVIDKRNRRVPFLDAHADAVYSHQIPFDMIAEPKHVQLMYGLRIGTVIDNPAMVMDSQVKEIIDSLRQCERGGQIHDIMDVITNPRTTLSERRDIATRFIKLHFDALLDQDKQDQTDRQEGQSGYGEGDFAVIYEQYTEVVHGHRHESDLMSKSSEKPSQSQSDSATELDSEFTERLAEVIRQAVAEERQAQDEANVNVQASRNAENELQANEQREALLSKLAGAVAMEMRLIPSDAESYVRSLDKWTGTIREVAHEFMKLASPSGVSAAPRYSRASHMQGIRLHPRTMTGVALQLATDQDQSIWQSVVHKANRQEVVFNGVDVHLLVDVSGSMSGRKALCAADTALCLIEGLQLARQKVARAADQYRQPDVRTQVIAFGSGIEVLSPLSHQPTGPQKGKTYANLVKPNSKATLISDALGYVQRVASLKPKRDAIIIIIGDGDFGDHDSAKEAVGAMPESVYTVQLVIGQHVQDYISNNNQIVARPSALPGKLRVVLADYIKKKQKPA